MQREALDTQRADKEWQKQQEMELVKQEQEQIKTAMMAHADDSEQKRRKEELKERFREEIQ